MSSQDAELGSRMKNDKSKRENQASLDSSTSYTVTLCELVGHLHLQGDRADNRVKKRCLTESGACEDGSPGLLSHNSKL